MRSLVDEMDLAGATAGRVVHHPGRRRHRGRGQGGRPPGAGDGRAAARHHAAPRSAWSTSCWACSAAARTRWSGADREPGSRRGERPTSWRWAPPACWARPPRSTAPSSCSPSAPSATPSATSCMERIRWWERYTAAQGTTIDGNPSPGNKAGGITTILEKSLGAVAKGGQSPLAEIVDYAAVPTGDGLRLHGHPRLRPGVRHRHGRRRREHHRLHHRPGLGVRQPPGADGQAGHQLRAGHRG